MLSFKNLAARIIDRARGELEADLRSRAFPEATAIPMTDWLAQLDARAQAALAASPPPDVPDGSEPDDGFYEDFDRRR